MNTVIAMDIKVQPVKRCSGRLAADEIELVVERQASKRGWHTGPIDGDIPDGLDAKALHHKVSVDRLLSGG